MKAALEPAAHLYLAASHIYRGDDKARIDALAGIAARQSVPLVATGDVLYHTPLRRPLQDVLTCIREKTTIAKAGFALEANAERHLKAPAEMARLFKGHEDALRRTVEIEKACRFSLDELAYEYPDEPVPPGETAQSQLERLSWEGATRCYPGGVPEKVREALTRELGLIGELNFAPYFLTVHDIVSFARSQNILCQGRGSAANSAVCYCLGITNVNPIEIDLLFERFISAERKEPPDIDVDFEHERREEVIQYIYARYGRERAGLAATVISYRARSAVREVGKAMGLSEDVTAALAGMVWGTRSGGVLPEKHVREAGLDPADPLLGRVLELADELMGFPRHLSQHVGGFVLTRGPLSEVVPIGNAAMEDRTCIEWDKDDLAALGLLKVDVLALGMLSCIHRAFDLLALHYKRPLTLATVPREDPVVYDMLCKADSIGVFQVESRAQMNMLPRLRPRCFYDLVIEVAIVRPGPIQGDMVHPYLRRRNGLEPEEYPSPAPEHGPADELRQILGKTKGVPLFQEQAMRIALVAARFSDGEVNELRKAMATFRRRGTIGQLEERMVSRMVERGYDGEFAQRCFNQIKGFGEYGFPESHAASFAHLVYVSSWLKFHYPDAFATAILNSQPMGFYAPAQLVRDAREHGVEVREADVCFSEWDSTLEAVTSPSPLLAKGAEGARSEGKAATVGRVSAANDETAGQTAGSARNPTIGISGRWVTRGSGDEAVAEIVPALTQPTPSFPLPVEETGRGEARFAVRLGLRQIDGLREEEAKKIVAARMTRNEGREARGEEGVEQGCSNVPTPVIAGLGPAIHSTMAWDSGNCRAMGPGNESRGDIGGWGESNAQNQEGIPPNPSLPASPHLAPTMPTSPSRGGVNERTPHPAFASVEDLQQRSGVSLATLERLAAADAFRSLGLDRRQALWAVKALAPGQPLPLFAWAETRDTGPDADVTLPAMPLSEHVVNDYQTLRLSLKAHPVSFLRGRLDGVRARSCAGLKGLRDGTRVKVGGVVLVRQRPGSANGVVFMTLEDETGIANAVIWPKTLERYRRVVMGARLILINGRIQRHEDIIHVVADSLEDFSSWLALLSKDDALRPAIARADEVLRPDPGSARGKAAGEHPRFARHPRNERIIPKSRDFH